MNEKILTVALAGNPNVGKSTLFNAITGMRQHTGNWAGKTVGNALGETKYDNTKLVFADIPGTYSLFAHSAEEEIARDYICFENPDKVVVVCDATCLERNLNLVVQTLEITDNVLVCINLIDEAERKNIKINKEKLSENLGVPVVSLCASQKRGINHLLKRIVKKENQCKVKKIAYTESIEKAIKNIQNVIEKENLSLNLNLRWLSVRLLESGDEINEKVREKTGVDLLVKESIKRIVAEEIEKLKENNYTTEIIKDLVAKATSDTASEVVEGVVEIKDETYLLKDRKIDKILTGKVTGIPVM